MSMVERVARAMLLTEHPTAGVKVWEVDPEAGRIWLARARVAIEAMREPNEAMLQASQTAIVDSMRNLGWSKAQRNERMSAQTKSIMRWTAMIDTALKGGPDAP